MSPSGRRRVGWHRLQGRRHPAAGRGAGWPRPDAHTEPAPHLGPRCAQPATAGGFTRAPGAWGLRRGHGPRPPSQVALAMAKDGAPSPPSRGSAPTTPAADRPEPRALVTDPPASRHRPRGRLFPRAKTVTLRSHGARFMVGAAPPAELQKRRRPGSVTPGRGTRNVPEGRRNRGERKRYFLCLENVAYRLTVESAARVFKGCILKPPSAPHTSPRCPLRPRGERGPPGGVSPAWSHRSPARPRLPAHRGADGGLSFPVAVPAEARWAQRTSSALQDPLAV